MVRNWEYNDTRRKCDAEGLITGGLPRMCGRELALRGGMIFRNHEDLTSSTFVHRSPEGVDMRLLRIVMIAVSLTTLIGSSPFAACIHKPMDGEYSTDAIPATILAGRASEAWCSGEGPGRVGNTQGAMSWDGATLGGQWKLWGMAIAAPGAVETSRYFDAFGNGYIDYITSYTGGQFWLSGAHAWGDGLGDFTGTITYYNVGAKVVYVGWGPVGVTSNVTMWGSFDSCNYCSIDYGYSNALLVWQTGDTAPMPGDYPPFLCAANAGELYDVCNITLRILCDVTGTEPSTWGKIKELYR